MCVCVGGGGGGGGAREEKSITKSVGLKVVSDQHPYNRSLRLLVHQIA